MTSHEAGSSNKSVERLDSHRCAFFYPFAILFKEYETVPPAHGGEDAGALLTSADDAETTLVIMAEDAAHKFIASGAFSQLLIA